MLPSTRPLVITSATESATCATTNTRCILPRPRADTGEASLMAAATFVEDADHAGASPHSNTHTSDVPSVKASTRQSVTETCGISDRHTWLRMPTIHGASS